MNSKPFLLDIAKCDTILIVDDDKMDLDLLLKDLKSLQIPLQGETDPSKALEFLINNPISLVISGYHMPKMSGIEFLQEAMKLKPSAQRILLTGDKDPEAAVNAVNQAHIYTCITKPWNRESLLHTIRSGAERHLLFEENQRLQKQLLQQYQKLIEAYQGLQHEVDLGARIHEEMLMGSVPDNLDGLEVAAFSLPSKEIDGDFFDFYVVAPDLVDFVIGEVMGKGVPAALVGNAVKANFTRFALPTRQTQIFGNQRVWEEDIADPEMIASKVHHELIDKLMRLGFFVSIFYARFNLVERILDYVDCGFKKPLHYQRKEKTLTELSGDITPLGMLKNVKYNQKRISFERGDTFVFFSDGVAGVKNSEGEMFGLEQLKQHIIETHEESVDEICRTLKQKIDTFRGCCDLCDDLTFVVVRVSYFTKVEKKAPIRAKFASSFSQLNAVRDLVKRSCLIPPVKSSHISGQLQLAINEIFCNIVKHGYRGDNSHSIVITIHHEEEGIRIDVADKGESFDPKEVIEPSLSGDRQEGFGWYILKQTMDKITYSRRQTDEGWNHLEIYKAYGSGTEKMQIDSFTDGDIMIIVPKINALDAKEVIEFRDKIMNIIDNENPTGTKKFIIDLGFIDFIDSSGLGSFLTLLRALKDRGGTLKICNVKKSVLTIFELVSMHKVFEIYKTAEEAKKSF